MYTKVMKNEWEEMLGRSFEPRQWFDEIDWPDHENQGGKIMWVYRKRMGANGNELYEVGFYSPDRLWHVDASFQTQRDAAQRVHWLNGGALESGATA